MRIAVSTSGDSSKVTANPGYDLVTMALDRADCVAEYVYVPRARAFLMMAQGTIDIVPAAIPTAERDRTATLVPYATARAVLVTLGSHPPLPQTIPEVIASGLRIGVVRGFDYGPGYRAVVDAPAMRDRIIESTDPELLLRVLMAKRSDAGLVFPGQIPDAVGLLGIGNQVEFTPVEGIPSVPTGTYVATRAMPPDDAKRVIVALRALARDGSVNRLLNQYYHDTPWVMTWMGTDIDPDTN